MTAIKPAILALLALAWLPALAGAASLAPAVALVASDPAASLISVLDRSGKTRRGKASYYARHFYGKEMADGTPMDPSSNAAASRTLPLGTKAKVRNLKNGKTAVVEIRDRGPYVKGRIIDVTPKIARRLGLKKDGVAPVAVTPIEVPPPEEEADASSEKRRRGGAQG